MTDLRETLEAGPVLITVPGESPLIVVGAWAFQVEDGLAWAVPGFDMTPGQAVHFVEGTLVQTGDSEWTWTTANGEEFELTPSEPHFSVDLKAEVDAWLAYRERHPLGTSRADARSLVEGQLCAIGKKSRILV